MRIIAGELKGREVVLPRGSRIRPATGYVRELAMNLFTPERLADGIFLDVCAGSGLTGFEALSRGASKTIFVEVDRKTIEHLRLTGKRFKVSERMAVISRDARHCFPILRKMLDGQQIAAAFLDPPYIPYMAADLLMRFGLASSILAPDGLLILRTRDDLPRDVPGLQFIERRAAGNGALWLFRPLQTPESDTEELHDV
jgi:16S rRNA (guanine966-N2)-methyltransferase